ncbi:hypothetical protein [Peribacillus sp. NPDC101480]|uniref:hypothetical protein n=1 Tax=Peribacillus sp. NPDC101480 TaxID=3390620 RepID=UPI003D04ABEF
MTNFAIRIPSAINKVINNYLHFFGKEYGYVYSNVLFRDGTTFVNVDHYGRVVVRQEEAIENDNETYSLPSELPVDGKEVKYAYSIVSSHRAEWGLIYLKFYDNTSILFQMWGDQEELPKEEYYLDVDHNEVLFVDLVLGVYGMEIVNQNLLDITVELTLGDNTIVRVIIPTDSEANIKEITINSISIVEKGHTFNLIENDISFKNFEHWIQDELNYLVKKIRS